MPDPERLRGCRPSCVCPQRGWVSLDSSMPHPCSTCCTVIEGRWGPAWPPAPSQKHYRGGQLLLCSESLWILLQTLNKVILQLHTTFLHHPKWHVKVEVAFGKAPCLHVCRNYCFFKQGHHEDVQNIKNVSIFALPVWVFSLTAAHVNLLKTKYLEMCTSHVHNTTKLFNV